MLSKIITSLIVLLSTMSAIGISHESSAHVLVTNENNTMGAVLHITPDDDPIAGESSHIFFDVQNKRLTDESYDATLTIIGDDGAEEKVKTEKDGSYVSARYVFPARGVYILKLSIEQQPGKTEQFSVTQRVSRGVTGAKDQNSQAVRHQWAEILVVASLACIGVLLIILLSQLRATFRQSQ